MGRPETLRVDGVRLQRSLEAMARIGATPGGGVTRLALSDEDRQARDLLVGWLGELGLAVAVDEMGNVFGRRPGRDDSLPPVLMGSHLDSQPQGGRFDGVYGVMGALEVLRTLADHEVETERPLVLVDWTNEEGSRFSPAMVASGVWAGALEREWAWARADGAGARLGDELARIGYRGGLPCRAAPFRAYFELHIEQGPRLEREGMTIGVPRGIVCLHWYDVTVCGEANQVGPTPMEGRHDALVAAAEMIGAVRAVTERLGGGLVATVGELHNRPELAQRHPGRDALHGRHPRVGRRPRAPCLGGVARGLRFRRRASRLRAGDGGDVAGRAQRVRPGADRAGRRDRRPSRIRHAAHGERGRPRRQLRGHGRPDGHDLRAQRRRPQSR